MRVSDVCIPYPLRQLRVTDAGPITATLSAFHDFSPWGRVRFSVGVNARFEVRVVTLGGWYYAAREWRRVQLLGV